MAVLAFPPREMRGAAVRLALEPPDLGAYDWVVVTSAPGVWHLLDRVGTPDRSSPTAANCQPPNCFPRAKGNS